ncbi:DnaJ-domain-containing protein [Rhizopus microsporus var. microsporus]|uniref:DnaJ-domain-containing protein n=2 Tax=Rhizopus microsporus TaxID=58291 RepID=A0A2G4TA09_RHIZD|nr:DnaJ-domain-containing protein [Rhizopus microsporus ATCC 52813]ORE10284.1 DnaJ-domain-containing protein [Rhizopus microsporus var. microsporus]PHZ17854.1 DnaJ-domain-containing protein [Rhizopus microsporus ATCC 52813]
MPFINKSQPPQQQQKEDKYRYVEEILSASDYYHVLGIKRNATSEEIRRAYIKKSRVCHPDKFVPSYPRATESFQILSIAYETLINPSTKLVYDLSKQKGIPYTSSSFASDDNNSNDTLQRVLHQLFNEMLEGEFQTLRAFIHALNETNPGMHITEDAILHIELAFRKMRELFQSTHQYYKVIQFELMRLYELQQELRQLSYFAVWKRMQLSITICKVLLQLPIIINTHSKQQKQLLEDSQTRRDEHQGILNQNIESALKLAVGLLESGERFTKSW